MCLQSGEQIDPAGQEARIGVRIDDHHERRRRSARQGGYRRRNVLEHERLGLSEWHDDRRIEERERLLDDAHDVERVPVDRDRRADGGVGGGREVGADHGRAHVARAQIAATGDLRRRSLIHARRRRKAEDQRGRPESARIACAAGGNAVRHDDLGDHVTDAAEAPNLAGGAVERVGRRHAAVPVEAGAHREDFVGVERVGAADDRLQALGQ